MRCAKCGILLETDMNSEVCPLCTSIYDAKNRGNSTTIDKTSNDKTDLQKAAENAILEYGGVRAAAKKLGINHGVLAMARDGREIPAAYRALGVRKTDRIRTCLDWGYDEDAERAREVFNNCGVSLKSVMLSWLNDYSWLIKETNTPEDAEFLINFMIEWYSEE